MSCALALAVGTFIQVAPPAAPPATPSSSIIYVKRCKTGCVVHFGAVDDSRTQTSSIAMDGDRTIGPFVEGDQVWNDMMDCVRTTYSPFGVTVTDIDPGPTVPHYENIVGGMPSDLRNDIPNAAGVAPFDCGEIANGISYTFDVVGPDAVTLCAIVSQETAHVFGLEHEYLPPDPMTYLQGDYPKRFQDTDAQCGEYVTRACACPMRPTQNSYRMILAFFGPGAPITPVVAITRPSDGKKVQPGFTVTATATSIIRIDHVELYVDGALAQTVTAEPYVFQPDGITDGDHALEVRAYDVQGTTGSAMETITMGPPCTPDKGCSNGDVCVMGLCIPGPSISGGLGTDCTDNDQCFSMICANGGDPAMHCAAACDVGNASACPHGFACDATGGGAGVCYPAPDAGGCCDAGGSPRGTILLGAMVAFALARRRR